MGIIPKWPYIIQVSEIFSFTVPRSTNFNQSSMTLDIKLSIIHHIIHNRLALKRSHEKTHHKITLDPGNIRWNQCKIPLIPWTNHHFPWFSYGFPIDRGSAAWRCWPSPRGSCGLAKMVISWRFHGHFMLISWWFHADLWWFDGL